MIQTLSLSNLAETEKRGRRKKESLEVSGEEEEGKRETHGKKRGRAVSELERKRRGVKI